MQLYTTKKIKRPLWEKVGIYTLLGFIFLGIPSVVAGVLLMSQTVNINMKEVVTQGSFTTTLNDVTPNSMNTIHLLVNNTDLVNNQYIQQNITVTNPQGATFTVDLDTSKITLPPNTLNMDLPMIINMSSGSLIGNITVVRDVVRV